MNNSRQNIFASGLCWLVVAAVLGCFLAAGHAQTAAGGGRWLLIFDASSAMKKRLPGTEAALRHFFITRGDGQLEEGDSVGVWTFDQQINAQFPTFAWSTELATSALTNLTAFLRQQRYRTESSPAVLETPLNHVVASSQRLTVVLFTDGAREVVGTPYDLGINKTFQDAQAERKKNRLPFAVVMRSQFGKFIGCTVNFPPGELSLPAFPPPPPPPPRPVVVIPPPAPVPALVIVGTHVSTDTNELVEKPSVEPTTNLTTAVIPVTAPEKPAVPTNVPPTNSVASPGLETTNPPAVVTNPPPVMAEVKPVAPPSNNIPAVAVAREPKNSSWTLVYLGMGLLALALAAVLLVRVRRRPQDSLITSSMENDSRQD
jgi:hypothetical protein